MGQWKWNILLPMSCLDYREAPRWTNHVWIDHQLTGSNKKRFQYFLGRLHSSRARAFQDYSGGNEVDPSLQDNGKIRKIELNTLITWIIFMICILLPNPD